MPPHLYSALPSYHSRDSLPFIRECAYCFDSVDSPGGVLLSLSGGATVCARCLPTEAARASVERFSDDSFALAFLAVMLGPLLDGVAAAAERRAAGGLSRPPARRAESAIPARAGTKVA